MLKQTNKQIKKINSKCTFEGAFRDQDLTLHIPLFTCGSKADQPSLCFYFEFSIVNWITIGCRMTPSLRMPCKHVSNIHILEDNYKENPSVHNKTSKAATVSFCLV